MLTTVASYLDLFRAEREAPDVVQAVRQYDPALAVVWDSAATRWVICRGNERGLHPQFTYQGEDGGYLPLDHRLARRLLEWDRWKAAPNAAAFAQAEKTEIESREAKSDADFHDEMEYAGRENRVTLNRLGNLHRELFG